jgi:hypothetical protein
MKAIERIQSLFKPENNIVFRNPLDGETKEFSAFTWLFLRMIMHQRYIKRGWIMVDPQQQKAFPKKEQ